MTTLPLCRDCSHFATVPEERYASCTSPAHGIDLVYGTQVTKNCETQRARTQATSCGKEGRFYEPQLPKKSASHFQPGQKLQAKAIGLPIFSGAMGSTPITVEVYALGVGVTLVREFSDLGSSEGELQLELNGKRLVINPLFCRKAKWLVAPVERHVSVIVEPVQAIDQQQLAQSSGSIHAHPHAKTAILSLPQGWGKTILAQTIARHLGCCCIVDEWWTDDALVPGALHLTHQRIVI